MLQCDKNMATSHSPVPDLPRVIIDPDALPFIKSGMAKLRDGLVAVIQEEIAKSDLTVESIRISLKSNMEEDWDELVFRILVDTDSDEAMRLWDSIGQSISEWRPKLSNRLQRLLDEQVGVFVEWK